MIKISLLVAALLFAAIFSSVSAAVPANVPCICTNGVSVNTAVSSHCACSGTCNNGYVLPFCNFVSTTRVNFAITYRNTSGFALDQAQEALQTKFGISGNDLKWIQRLTRFETQPDEIVVQYLITGSYVDQIYTDVWATGAGRPSYIDKPYPALDMWQLGTVVSEAGVFARHYAKGNVLSTVDVSGSSSKLQIYDSQFEFFIGGLTVVLTCAIMEGIFNLVFKPKETPEEQAEREARFPQQAQQGQQQQPYPTAGVYNQGQEMKQQPAPIVSTDSNPTAPMGYSNNVNHYPVAYDNSVNNPLSYEHQDPIPTATQQPQEEAAIGAAAYPVAEEHPNYQAEQTQQQQEQPSSYENNNNYNNTEEQPAQYQALE